MVLSLYRKTVLVTAAAGALGLATVDIAANALGAKVGLSSLTVSHNDVSAGVVGKRGLGLKTSRPKTRKTKTKKKEPLLTAIANQGNNLF